MAVYYDKSTRKLGDGYTFYKTYADTAEGTNEPTVIETMADDVTFGGTDPAGSEFSVEREVFDDDISQELSRIDTLIIGEKATFKITYSAGDIEKLALGMGLEISDIENIGSGLMPGDYAARAVMIGGRTNLATLALVLKVCNAFSPLLNDYLFMPRCQANPSAAMKFVRNEIRKMESTFDILPSKAATFVGDTTCESMHGLAKFMYETL